MSTSSGRGKPRLLLALVLVAAAGAWVWHRTSRDPAPQVPEVVLAGAHPEVAAAIQSAVDAIRHQPRDPKAWGDLSCLLIANGFHEQALPILEQTQRLEPGSPVWPYLQASVFVLVSKPLEAAAKFDEALPLARNAEERAAIAFYSAQVELEQGRIEPAGRAVQMLREAEGESPRVQFVTGLVELARGNRDAARERLLPLAEHPSARKQVCAILASLDHSDPTLAARFRAQANQLPPDLPWPTSFDTKVRNHRIRTSTGLELFQDLMLSGRHEEALRHLQELAEQSPSETVFFTLGTSLLRNHDLRGAELAFGRTLEFNAKHTKARMLLGAAILGQAEELQAAGRSKEATNRFEEVVRVESAVVAGELNSALPHVLLGRAHWKLNHPEEAKTAFRNALLIAPDMFDAHLALGELLAEEGQAAPALEHLENAVRMAPPQDPEPQKVLDKWKAKLKPTGK